MYTLDEYKVALCCVSDIAQCICFVDDLYYKQNKDVKYVVVVTKGATLKQSNELREEGARKYIGTFEELKQQFIRHLKGANPRLPRTFFLKIISSRGRRDCIVMRPYIAEIDG